MTACTGDPEEKPVKLPYIPHPQLQDGFGYFICEDKKCKQQILPQIDGYNKTVIMPHPEYPNRDMRVTTMVTMCRNCNREYTREDLKRLTKKKKMLRAVKITM